PGDTPAMLRENVRRTIQDSDFQGIKLQLLHLMTNTKMMRDYNEGRLQLMSKEAFVSEICEQLQMIPPEIVIHRLTGDPPFETNNGALWSLKKWEVLNA
ncbi:TIGR01212 family radical SAM protein, partial [Enterococcus faecalis]